MRRKQGVKNLGKSISCRVVGREVGGRNGERERRTGVERDRRKRNREHALSA